MKNATPDKMKINEFLLDKNQCETLYKYANNDIRGLAESWAYSVTQIAQFAGGRKWGIIFWKINLYCQKQVSCDEAKANRLYKEWTPNTRKVSPLMSPSSR